MVSPKKSQDGSTGRLVNEADWMQPYCQCLLRNEEDADDYDPGLLDYPCTRVVTVVNAGAIKKRSRAPGEDAGEPTPPPPPHRAEPEEKQNAASSREGRRRDAIYFCREPGYFGGGRS